MQNKISNLLPKIVSISLVFAMLITTLVTNDLVVSAKGLFDNESDVIEVDSIEKVKLNDTVDTDSDSDYKSCRLIIFSANDLEFEEAKSVINAIPFSISAVTFMELLQGARNRNEMDAIKKEFNEMGVHIIPINARISSETANLVEEYTLSHSMEMTDALIAGTCLENNEELLTANDKHYRMIDNIEIEVFRS